MRTYWRQQDDEIHCYTRLSNGDYQSMCGLEWPHKHIYGPRVERPAEEERCGRCDIEEQELFGNTSPMPQTTGAKNE